MDDTPLWGRAACPTHAWSCLQHQTARVLATNVDPAPFWPRSLMSRLGTDDGLLLAQKLLGVWLQRLETCGLSRGLPPIFVSIFFHSLKNVATACLSKQTPESVHRSCVVATMPPPRRVNSMVRGSGHSLQGSKAQRASMIRGKKGNTTGKQAVYDMILLDQVSEDSIISNLTTLLDNDNIYVSL